jgi:MoCo/4Fe-4S cofactor protein with predicted Tat translocation signal
MAREPLDIAAVRAQLAGKQGRQYWRSLEELADTAEFHDLLHREFPRQADELSGALSRRQFLATVLRLMGASLALAGLSACGAPPEALDQLVPYVNQPEGITPGEPLFFATAARRSGYAIGVLARSNEGRPTKIEGNPDHPASLGATDVFAQASLLSLYDPDRSQAVLHLGRTSTWDSFLAALSGMLDFQRTSRGAGLRLLTGAISSPTLIAQIQALLGQFPAAKWHQYEPVGRDNMRAGARLAFGEDANVRYQLDKADVILSLDADFMYGWPGSVRYARDFVDRRRVRAGQTTMNRLYLVEPSLTVTGSNADHRLPVRARDVEQLARAVAAGLGVAGVQPAAALPASIPPAWITALTNDLLAHRGSSLVLAGDGQPPVVHALAHAMNAALGNVGNTVVYTAPVEAGAGDGVAALRELVADLAAGSVSLLFILDGNPAYSAPADLDLAAQLAKASTVVHLSLYEDETSALSHWHIPAAHDLESWSDARAYDGTATIIQPLIAPLYGGKTAHELLAALLGQPDQAGLAIIRGYWQGQGLADAAWRRALHDGLIANSALPPKQVALAPASLAAQPAPADDQAIEIVFCPDPTIWDGQLANNGWLQELPKPITTITWDNAAFISPASAESQGLASADVVELRYAGRSVRAPVWVQPGHADGSVTLHLGYGRTRAGQVGSAIGVNAYALRTANAPWFGSGLELRKTSERYTLATTQNHYLMEGRELVRTGTLAEFQQNPLFAQLPASDGPHESLYPAQPSEGYAWGMTIDTNACIGCGACTIACQAENNIPVVGKDQVAAGREMHWIRVDSYYAGELENPEVVHQPVPCMHCENAPCELVCPVAATVHTSEGLNAMVYNRCVGTRYCSNNCPYKVRRFNFFQYARKDIPVIALAHNPEVTVRDRGVMEKCTYCVQRISKAKIAAEKQDRPVRDGEILTACQQVCPTQAITFGNINDQSSQVAQLKAEPLNYHLLGELNTRPRTTYLARLRNPNPEIKE